MLSAYKNNQSQIQCSVYISCNVVFQVLDYLKNKLIYYLFEGRLSYEAYYTVTDQQLLLGQIIKHIIHCVYMAYSLY